MIPRNFGKCGQDQLKDKIKMHSMDYSKIQIQNLSGNFRKKLDGQIRPGEFDEAWAHLTERDNGRLSGITGNGQNIGTLPETATSIAHILIFHLYHDKMPNKLVIVHQAWRAQGQLPRDNTR